MKYWAFFPSSKGDGATLSCVPKNGPKSYKYDKAISLVDSFDRSEDAVMCFDSNFSENNKLYDILDCLDGVIVINETVKGLFEQENVLEEFLPVTLWDHTSTPISENYYILNNLNLIDFIDTEKSEIAWDVTFKDRIYRTERLVIKEGLQETPPIFRPTNMKKQYFITDDFKLKLETAGITGYKVFEADGWDGLGF